MSLNELTISKAAEGLGKKEFSSAELTKAVFEQIKKRDRDIHAFFCLMKKALSNELKEIDEERVRGEALGELAGIPVAIKDNMLVKGSRMYRWLQKFWKIILRLMTQPSIKKLKEAGAVILGKTNMDEFAMGSSTENSAYGPTKNPRDLERVPGGSSGGSAAAVAADECDLRSWVLTPAAQSASQLLFAAWWD